jgi:hypothetical protein
MPIFFFGQWMILLTGPSTPIGRISVLRQVLGLASGIVEISQTSFRFPWLRRK